MKNSLSNKREGKTSKEPIAFFSIADSPGGAEQLLQQIASYKKKQGEVIVFIFKTQKTNFWKDKGFEVIYFNGSIVRFYKALRKEHFSFVMSSHLLLNGLLGFSRAIGLLKTKYLICRESTSVFLRYNGVKLWRYRLCYIIGYRRMDLLITQSSTMREGLLENVAFLQRRMIIKTIPNVFSFPKGAIKELSFNFPFIVSAGRLIPEKGFDLLIDAFAKLKKEQADIKLIILGEGVLRNDLLHKIKENGLEGDVILKGFVTNVYSYFKAARACVISSRIEGFPNVLLQMMSQNNKVVSTLCAGGIAQIKGIETCPAGDNTKLYESIKKALSLNENINKSYFMEELVNRSPENFIRKIEDHL